MRRTGKLVCAALALQVVFGLGLVWAEESDVFSADGEIVDMACYVSREAKGPDHAGCAKSCVKNGQPMGLLTDEGTLYLLYASHKDGAPFETAKDHAGAKVTISGKLSTTAGVKGIEVSAVKAL
jgi:hypothetical protein